MEGVPELIELVAKQADRVCRIPAALSPRVPATREWLSANTIGRILAVQAQVAEYLPGFHAYEDYRGSYAARRELGGGVVLSQIHELDYLQALLGMPERVFTLGGKLSSLEIDVEDLASSLLEFRHSDGGLLPVHLHQDYLQRPSSRSCQITGDMGMVRWDHPSGRLERFDAHGILQDELDFSGLPRNQLFLDEIKHFLACLDGSQQPRVSLREAANSLIIAGAILKSIQTGQPVTLE